jgi:hypothetical protein
MIQKFGVPMRLSGNLRGGFLLFQIASERLAYQEYTLTCKRWSSSSLCRDLLVTCLHSYSRLTFLGGGRACIGFKFSQLEMSRLSQIRSLIREVTSESYSQLRAEVVLSLLLESFKFAPSGQDIIWKWNGIVQPTTKEAQMSAEGDKSLALPLKVSFA